MSEITNSGKTRGPIWMYRPDGVAFLDVIVNRVPREGGYLSAASLRVSDIISVLGTSVVSGDDELAARKAHGLVIITGGVPTANDTITLDGVAYTWKAAPTAAKEVDIGADAATSALNLIAAIMVSGTEDSEYGAGTIKHPTIDAAVDGNGMIELSYALAGVAGNGVVLSESSDNLTLLSTALIGGREQALAPGPVVALPNTQTDSPTEDDAGDLFIRHSYPGTRKVRVSLLATMLIS